MKESIAWKIAHELIRPSKRWLQKSLLNQHPKPETRNPNDGRPVVRERERQGVPSLGLVLLLPSILLKSSLHRFRFYNNHYLGSWSDRLILIKLGPTTI